MRTKSSAQLTLRDKLSRFTLIQAQKLLGPQGAHWIAKGGNIEIDTAKQVRLTDDVCEIDFPLAGVDGAAKLDKPTFPVTRALGADKHDHLVVTLALHPGYRDRLQIGCNSSGDTALLYQGASLAMILEQKTSLGLAAAPIEDTPWELLSEEQLISRALLEREKRSNEGMALKWMPDRIAVFARYDGDLGLGLEAPARVSQGAKPIVAQWKVRVAREPAELVELFESVRALAQIPERLSQPTAQAHGRIATIGVNFR